MSPIVYSVTARHFCKRILGQAKNNHALFKHIFNSRINVFTTYTSPFAANDLANDILEDKEVRHLVHLDRKGNKECCQSQNNSNDAQEDKEIVHN